MNEFFQVRVAALRHMEQENPRATDISQESIHSILSKIYGKNGSMLEKLSQEINATFPALEDEGIFYKQAAFDSKSKAVEDFFKQFHGYLVEVSRLENQKVYAGFFVDGAPFFIKIPKYRIFWLDTHHFTTTDDLILNFPRHFFGDKKISFSFTISVDRDTDLTVTDTADKADFIRNMEESLEHRRFSPSTRILVHAREEDKTAIKETLAKHFPAEQIFFVSGFVHPEFLIGLKKGFHQYDFLKNEQKENDTFPDMMVRFRSLTKNHRPCCPEIVTSSILSYLDKKDLVVHFPYESYFPVLKFISDAAENENVTEIKITLYRTEHNSRIVNELVLASLKGKKITVFMEIKARFNEQLNIQLGKILEDAGIKVLYSLEKLKVHAKMALVVAKNACYTNMSTGNYNSETSYIYSDIALFTSKPQIASQVAQIFDAIEKKPTTLSDVKNSFLDFYAQDSAVFTSPFFIKRKIISLIQAEAKHGAEGCIVAKMNNLGDEDIIMELERAAHKGVKIMLNVRGICQLYAQENIRIISIVGKFLEHSRIFYFKNGGAEKLFVSSSDWLRRNLDKRLEIMFEILDSECFEKIKHILMSYFKDESHAHEMSEDGTWLPPKNVDGFCAQDALLQETLTQSFP